jgi:Dihydrouridine synthase (Dus)
MYNRAMLGRAAYDHPYLFAEADALCCGDAAPPHTRRQVLEAMLSYLERWAAQGLPPYRIVRHLLNLFAYQRAARLWKRSLSERTWAPETAVVALQEAMSLVPDAILDAYPQAVEHTTHSVHLCDTRQSGHQKPPPASEARGRPTRRRLLLPVLAKQLSAGAPTPC